MVAADRIFRPKRRVQTVRVSDEFARRSLTGAGRGRGLSRGWHFRESVLPKPRTYAPVPGRLRRLLARRREEQRVFARINKQRGAADRPSHRTNRHTIA